MRSNPKSEDITQQDLLYLKNLISDHSDELDSPLMRLTAIIQKVAIKQYKKRPKTKRGKGKL